ncbi:MAG: hypothetical protein U9Q07_00310 [Planctomycetota bacterium]|nr:hypothetical protein [Planctomycetota bacterium]
MSVMSWLDAMIRQYGVQLLFTVARVIGFGLSIWLTVVITNWYRDRDEKRNIEKKPQRLIEHYRGDRDYWRHRAEDAEKLAGNRLATIRASMASMHHAAMQLRGAGDDEPAKLRKVK